MRVDPNYLQTLSTSIQQSTATEATLTSELSSGLRVQQVSDDPMAASQALAINSQIQRGDTFVQTATAETGGMQSADAALAEVVTQLTSAISLATQATNGTLTTAQQTAIASQLQGIQSEVLTLANSSYQGQYLFAGSKGGTAPFAADGSYSGDTVQQTIKTPAGQSIATSLPGSSIFASVFAALGATIANLQASPSTVTAADSTALTAALSNVSTQRSVLDSNLSRMTATSTYTQTQIASLQATESTLVSADTVQVATDVKDAEMQHTAMLSLMAALSKGSLFDYLK